MRWSPRSLLSLFSNDLAIDLGTANSLVFSKGRGIVVNVIATDREAGVDSVRLFRALGDDPGNLVYQQVSEDAAAPFQFHIQGNQL